MHLPQTARRARTIALVAVAGTAAGLVLHLPSASAVLPVAGPPAPFARAASVQAPADAPAREARAASRDLQAAARATAVVRAAAARTAALRADAARAEAARASRARSLTSDGAAACSGPGWQQRRGAAALASLRPAPTTASAVRFRPARAGLLGLAHLDSRVVEVFVRSCAAQSDALLRHVLAHELGHVHDQAHLTPALREAWMRARGIAAGTAWYGCDRCSDFATPAGDFAETYAQWRRGASSSRSRLAPAPGPAALQALATRFFLTAR